MQKIGLKYQGGFIITLELILIFTILVIGTLVGIIAIRDALFKHYVNKQSEEVVVIDGNAIPLGEAIGFDEHEAPRIFYIDRGAEVSKRVIIGVRDDRFTSREPLYYQGENCQGDPCIKSVSDESSDNVGVDGISASGSVSYFNALQGFPNYAVGRGDTGLPGRLFKETPNQCSAEVSEIRSRWISQKVVAGEPCEAFSLELITESAYTNCLVNTLEPCSCPVSYVDQGDILERNLPAVERLLNTVTGIIPIIPDLEIGTICCPEGMVLVDDGSESVELDLGLTTVSVGDVGDLVGDIVFTLISTVIADIPEVSDVVSPIIEPLGTQPQCRSVYSLRDAEQVLDPSGTENAFDAYQAPFTINQSGRAGSEAWISTPPSGEGNSELIQ